MKKKTIWNFTYKGINCEIVNWNFETRDDYFKNHYPSGNWNGYIYIDKKQLPRQFKKLLCDQKVFRSISNRKFWNYSKLEGYFDMHGDITYYELIRDEFTGEASAIKVGCDYLHLFDSRRNYNQDDIERDLKASVDKFIESFPNYLVWDFKDGKYRRFDILEESK